ncbi:uncharacterized protein BO95DRAFT_445401 [Aspergillus brunneoviolaceus CBS 621.78]|uniref:Uncharacterized protein n=1 Tax=Aspergillus brunneoviolaceus CBS 621.78 TaxID=1450534 RepID=A0ACD1G1B6_9EURO|nr:hypothetical protein BO95DRAFT_445401 [Aspergillus brunneoviolaceus CBS 621.78]RAH43063.1 hypothetical protein BO95DRAFT_445401 [Aspergillus brunneoviolaceus CBS 621.78]
MASVNSADPTPPTALANSNPEYEANVADIEDALKNRRLTLVFGTGISINAIKDSTAGVSDDEKSRKADTLRWNALILSGLQFIENNPDYKASLTRSEIQELDCYKSCLSTEGVALGTMLRAAIFLRAKLKELGRLQAWFKLEFSGLYDKFIGDNPNPMLESIKELNRNHARIMTTNYDDLISRRCDKHAIIPDEEQKLKDFFSANSESRRRILHIHGIWNDPKSIVLDGVNYYKITTHPYLQHALQTCMGGTEVLVFVGTGGGLDDPNFSGLLRWANEVVGEERRPQYILLPDGQNNKHKSLHAIHYGDHSRLPEFLKGIVRRVTG